MKKTTKRLTKKDIYKIHGIEFDSKTGKIFHSVLGWIPVLLIDGNSKIGKGVYHFSTLPTNKSFHVAICGMIIDICGTCPCSCVGCYATTGKYNCDNVIESLAIKTWLVYNDLDFVKRAIIAQIHADNVKLCRIHASGDFFSINYIDMWKEIVTVCADCVFWSYTKNTIAENAFDSFDNINIVKSVIHGFGFNFGKIEYVLRVYKALTEMNVSVYLCRCSIDDKQHCVNCKGCSKNEFVLFVEHSTGYNAKKDALYNELVELIEKQPKI